MASRKNNLKARLARAKQKPPKRKPDHGYGTCEKCSLRPAEQYALFDWGQPMLAVCDRCRGESLVMSTFRLESTTKEGITLEVAKRIPQRPEGEAVAIRDVGTGKLNVFSNRPIQPA